ncbi:MAG: hypothetical protein JNM51_17035 [Bacteroidia bacterium]|nr:hypothetical protein [Bacteroidia bacterium]
MGKIDIHNYEAYLLDYSEGNLTDELLMELELFLIQHPELDINLSELSLVSLKEESVSFLNKNNLKKSEADLVSEMQFIAYIENQLPSNEMAELEKSCSINPLLSKELALYQKTIVQADELVVYPNKQKLKRKPKIIWLDFSVIKYSAAACILFLVGLFFFFSNKEVANHTNDFADLKKQEAVVKNDIKNKGIETSVAVNANHIAVKSNVSAGVASKKSTKLQAGNNHHTGTKNEIAVIDTLKEIKINSLPVEPIKEETLIALNTAPITKQKNNTVVQVITETDDEPMIADVDKKKTGIWAAASRALKNLNHAGVKSVNGNETEDKAKSSYALTLGDIRITHKAGL